MSDRKQGERRIVAGPLRICGECKLPIDAEARKRQDERENAGRGDHTRWRCEACGGDCWGSGW